jgi:hypothetical protein
MKSTKAVMAAYLLVGATVLVGGQLDLSNSWTRGGSPGVVRVGFSGRLCWQRLPLRLLPG